MADILQAACEAMQARFKAELQEFRGDKKLILPAEHIVEALTALRENFHFEMLTEITAVDYWRKREPRFDLVYRVYSVSQHVRLELRTPLAGNDPHTTTVEGVYRNANWYEREVWDMFGIHFDGHSDPRRILMPGDWQGHPLRKDYPLGYEEVQFSFNYDEIQSRKPNPEV